MFAKETVKKLGGQSNTAKLLGISRTAVFYWVHSKDNQVPIRHHASIRRILKKSALARVLWAKAKT